VYPYSGSGVNWVRVGGLNWAVTDASGAYALPYALSPTGFYRVGFEDPSFEYLDQFYSGASTVESGTSVYVAGTTATVNATLSLAGISGTVGEGSTPKPNITVKAFVSDGLGGWGLAKSVLTTAGGAYHIGGLAPGDYKVLFLDGAYWVYLAQYFSGSTFSAATVVSVSATSAASGIDASLTRMTADAYEPDDSSADAKPIVVNAPPQFHTALVYDRDWVYLDVVAGHRYWIATHSSSGYLWETNTFLGLYKDDGWVGFDDDSGGGWYSRIAYTPSSDGILYIRAEAPSGNIGGYLLDVTRDEAAPLTSDDAPGGWVTHDLTLTLSATDSGSGVASIDWRRAAPGGAVTTGTTGATSVALPVTAEGTTSVAYSAADADGNRSATATATVRVDKTPPTTTAPSTASYVGTATVPLTAADAASGVDWTRWSLDAGLNWTTGTSVMVAGLGSHTITYQSADVAGNTETTKTVTFTVNPAVSPTSVTIKTTATSARTGSVPILSGAVTPNGMIGRNIVAYVKKPGKTYWTYSSNRTVYNLGGKAAWQYKYYFKPGMVKGYYVFKAVVPAWPGFLTSTSPTTVSIRLQ